MGYAFNIFFPSPIYGGSAGALAEAMGGAPLVRYKRSANFSPSYRRKSVGAPHFCFLAPRGAHFPHKGGKE